MLFAENKQSRQFIEKLSSICKHKQLVVANSAAHIN